MLRTLYIRDYALIEELEVEFDSGLNILTGETGAGKSIIMGALKMVLGERASTDLVRSGSRKAVVEGVFEDVDVASLQPLFEEHGIDEGSTLILRRALTTTHSRAFINDTPVTLPVMRAVAAQLIDLHGRHEHQSLLQTEKHVALLDDFGDLGSLLDDYRRHYGEMAGLVSERDELAGQKDRLQEEQERLAFEMEEIDAISPQLQEEDALDAECLILENAEWLYSATVGLYERLYASEGAVNDQLVVARNELQAIARVDVTFAHALEELQSAQIAVSEIAGTLQEYHASIEFSPDRLEAIRERQSKLEWLKRKYGGSLQAVVNYREEIGRLHERARNFDASLREVNEKLDKTQHALTRAALRLSGRRHEVAEHLEGAITEELAKLGMPQSRLQVRFEQTRDPDGWIHLPEGETTLRAFRKGMDKVEFYITTNVGTAPRPLAHVVSGGEMSRIMLALKTILARSDRIPILVFDEIDSGVSGSIAHKVGESMRVLSQYHQIITITHLPQVAALGNAHFVVEKHADTGHTRTNIRRLADEERPACIAALMAGSEITEATLASARELMASGG